MFQLTEGFKTFAFKAFARFIKNGLKPPSFLSYVIDTSTCITIDWFHAFSRVICLSLIVFLFFKFLVQNIATNLVL